MNKIHDAFRQLLLRAYADGSVTVPCDRNRAHVLRIQLYNYMNKVRKAKVRDPELIEALEGLMLKLVDSGLEICSKLSTPEMKSVLKILGGEEAVAKAAETAPKLDAALLDEEARKSQELMLRKLADMGQEVATEDAPVRPDTGGKPRTPYY